MTRRAVTMIRLTETGHRTAAPGRILGCRVTDRDGNPLGTVDDLLVDAEAQRLRLISVEHGGVVGFGATPSFIPVEAVDEVTGEGIRIALPSAQVADAPLYDPTVMGPREFCETLYGYYGCRAA
ncbi:PRC-barrel domain-containing protein [Couchioplanes caeruleus]|uniref:PRC-barrel domain-containing protein n=1 Tax=Couchioplanes caeruleus TaxID=56438 RepID=UPI0020C149F6|nr:PRC-barrel domain-containing protein [Couchioplanes caeruleus]UQU67980.1 PRC-barrel domain-containing protein [Couchioplanes caeruleus]